MLEEFPDKMIATVEEARCLVEKGGYTYLDVRPTLELEEVGKRCCRALSCRAVCLGGALGAPPYRAAFWQALELEEVGAAAAAVLSYLESRWWGPPSGDAVALLCCRAAFWAALELDGVGKCSCGDDAHAAARSRGLAALSF